MSPPVFKTFKLVLNAATILTQLKGFIHVNKENLQGLVIGDLYPVHTETGLDALSSTDLYRGEDFLVRKGTGTRTQLEGTTYCKQYRAELFTVRPNMDLTEIFTRLNVNSVWADLELDKTSTPKRIVTQISKYAPPLSAKGKSIGINGQIYAGDKTKVILTKLPNGNFEYDSAHHLDRKETLCVQDMDFPRSGSGIHFIEETKVSMLKLFNKAEDLVTVTNNRIIANDGLWPAIASSEIGTANLEIIDLNENFTRKAQSINTGLTEIVNTMKNLKSPTQLFLNVEKLRNELGTLESAVGELFHLYLNPEQAIPHSFWVSNTVLHGKSRIVKFKNEQNIVLQVLGPLTSEFLAVEGAGVRRATAVPAVSAATANNLNTSPPPASTSVPVSPTPPTTFAPTTSQSRGATGSIDISPTSINNTTQTASVGEAEVITPAPATAAGTGVTSADTGSVTVGTTASTISGNSTTPTPTEAEGFWSRGWKLFKGLLLNPNFFLPSLYDLVLLSLLFVVILIYLVDVCCRCRNNKKFKGSDDDIAPNHGEEEGEAESNSDEENYELQEQIIPSAPILRLGAQPGEIQLVPVSSPQTPLLYSTRDSQNRIGSGFRRERGAPLHEALSLLDLS